MSQSACRIGACWRVGSLVASDMVQIKVVGQPDLDTPPASPPMYHYISVPWARTGGPGDQRDELGRADQTGAYQAAIVKGPR